MKVSSKNVMAGLKPALMGAAGGYVGNQVANFAQKQTFMAGKEMYSPAISALLGLFGMVAMPKMKDFFQGMAVVSATELLEKGTNVAVAAATTTTTTAGQSQGTRGQMGRTMGQMGFVTKMMVDSQGSLTVKGTKVR
jgi:hypothetical protein